MSESFVYIWYGAEAAREVPGPCSCQKLLWALDDFAHDLNSRKAWYKKKYKPLRIEYKGMVLFK